MAKMFIARGKMISFATSFIFCNFEVGAKATKQVILIFRIIRPYLPRKTPFTKVISAHLYKVSHGNIVRVKIL